MTRKTPISPEENYLRRQIASQIFDLKRLHGATVEKIGESEEINFVGYLLDIVWLETSASLRADDHLR